jgi:hypothetical protein
MDKSSLFKLSGLPDSFGGVLLGFSFILLLAPYFSGADFGLFKIPTFTQGAKKWLKIIGPILFAVCVFAFIPVFPADKKAPTDEAKITPSPSPILTTHPGPLPSASPSSQPTPQQSQTAAPETSPVRKASQATVRITIIPPYDPVGGRNSKAHIAGEVSGVTPENYRVVIYALTNMWYIQPTMTAPLTIIQPDGKWSADIQTGTNYAALLVHPDYNPLYTTDSNNEPSSIGDVVAATKVEGKRGKNSQVKSKH